MAKRSTASVSARARKKAAELPEWDLSDLYSGMDSPELAADLASFEKRVKAFEKKYKGRLAHLAKSDVPRLARSVKTFEALSAQCGRISAFADLVYAGDTSAPHHIKFYGDIGAALTQATSHILFYSLELNRISDRQMAKALKNRALAHYAPWLKDLRKEKPYELEERVEKLFHEKSLTGYSAWNRLFDETIAAMRFKVSGKTLTIEPTLTLLQDPSAVKRAAAAKALSRTFKENLSSLTLITNTLAKDKEISDRWRGFADSADSRHLSNRVEGEVVEALVSAVSAAYPRLSHRYYKMKARWFSKRKLNYWDRNAPLPQARQTRIPWEQARQIVIDAYDAFSPEMARIARDFFDRNWIDARPRTGKAPGAFAHPTVPGVHPYVLLNYMGKTRDVMTLAHELGHGVHQVLAARQGALMAPTPLTLAETASVFGEMLTFRSLLANAPSAQVRKTLLAGKVEDMINTVVRQIAFYQFERKVHAARREGELTADRLGEFWLQVQSESLGPAIKLNPGYETYWVYIPHFIHSPFYVYAYAFGDCLVNSLYALYENAEPDFVERYFAMLRAGGTKHHSQLLAPFGLDARDTGFWRKGLTMLEGLIDALEAT